MISTLATISKEFMTFISRLRERKPSVDMTNFLAVRFSPCKENPQKTAKKHRSGNGAEVSVSLRQKAPGDICGERRI